MLKINQSWYEQKIKNKYIHKIKINITKLTYKWINGISIVNKANEQFL